MIEIKDLSFRYGDHKALDGINLEIREGEWIAVMGANGSGKTTLARCLNGLLLPTGGDVLVDGCSVLDEGNLWDIRKRIGMVFQNPDNQIVSTMVEREIAFGLENLGIPTDEMRARVEEALARFDLTEYRRHPPHKLSGGEKQRLAIASVWAMRPRVMVLDEPASLLDPKGRREIEHILKTLDAADRQTILHITQFPPRKPCWPGASSLWTPERSSWTARLRRFFAKAQHWNAWGSMCPSQCDWRTCCARKASS
jgi:energy-coupling factor transport system ATP-binding protein